MSTPDNICANCGKGEECSGNLKACTACKMAKYCNRDCQIAHRPQHKKACKKRAAELRDEALFKDPPSREECPICTLLLPIDVEQIRFKSCCGKIICMGCIDAMSMEEVRKGKKEEEMFMCPYCRTPPHSSDEEEIERLAKLMDNDNAVAFVVQGVYYADGTCGLQQDMVKANELWRKAGELGCAEAYSRLGYSFSNGMGVEVDKKKAVHYYELAAIKGDVLARHNLGCMEGQAGNSHRLMKHLMLAARSGYTPSLDGVTKGFTRAGYVTKEEYANTLREYQKRMDEMKSDTRDTAAENTKRINEEERKGIFFN